MSDPKIGTLQFLEKGGHGDHDWNKIFLLCIIRSINYYFYVIIIILISFTRVHSSMHKEASKIVEKCLLWFVGDCLVVWFVVALVNSCGSSLASSSSES